jgi:hypothetical protein
MDELWFCLIVLCTIVIAGLIDWAKCERKKQRARQKAVEPIDGNDWIWYNRTGIKERIKANGHDLREITYGRREK